MSEARGWARREAAIADSPLGEAGWSAIAARVCFTRLRLREIESSVLVCGIGRAVRPLGDRNEQYRHSVLSIFGCQNRGTRQIRAPG